MVSDLHGYLVFLKATLLVFCGAFFAPLFVLTVSGLGPPPISIYQFNMHFLKTIYLKKYNN